MKTNKSTVKSLSSIIESIKAIEVDGGKRFAHIELNSPIDETSSKYYLSRSYRVELDSISMIDKIGITFVSLDGNAFHFIPWTSVTTFTIN